MITGNFMQTECRINMFDPDDRAEVNVPGASIEVTLSDAGANGIRVEIQIDTARNGKTITVEDGFIHS